MFSYGATVYYLLSNGFQLIKGADNKETLFKNKMFAPLHLKYDLNHRSSLSKDFLQKVLERDPQKRLSV